MNTSASAQYGFASIANQAISNALYDQGAELERREFSTARAQEDDTDQQCEFSLIWADEHQMGHYYHFVISRTDFDVTVALKYENRVPSEDTDSNDPWSHSTEVSVTGNPRIDTQIIESIVANHIRHWVLSD